MRQPSNTDTQAFISNQTHIQRKKNKLKKLQKFSRGRALPHSRGTTTGPGRSAVPRPRSAPARPPARSRRPPKLREDSGRLRPALSAAGAAPPPVRPPGFLPSFPLPSAVLNRARLSRAAGQEVSRPCRSSATTGAVGSASTLRTTRRVRAAEGPGRGASLADSAGNRGGLRGSAGRCEPVPPLPGPAALRGCHPGCRCPGDTCVGPGLARRCHMCQRFSRPT